MIPATQIRNGMVIIHNNEPHKVINFRFTMSGRGSNSIPVKLRNLLTGAQVELRYRSDDKVERGYIEEDDYEYLYQDSDDYWFMNKSTYEQIALKREDIEDVIGYLLPNATCKVQLYNGKPIGVEVPNTIHVRVIETEPVIKGATASGNVTKPAKLETGITIQVPMFVQQGDIVVLNTVTGEYQGRPGK